MRVGSRWIKIGLGAFEQDRVGGFGAILHPLFFSKFSSKLLNDSQNIYPTAISQERMIPPCKENGSLVSKFQYKFRSQYFKICYSTTCSLYLLWVWFKSSHALSLKFSDYSCRPGFLFSVYALCWFCECRELRQILSLFQIFLHVKVKYVQNIMYFPPTTSLTLY